ncbi:MAG: glycosyltransferase family 2 protein [bacterium]|nr:glycosyltransferase family 2 protein [bacterium]
MISFVIPLYNEEATLVPLYEHIERVMERSGLYEFEILFIDDGSRDASWGQLELLCQKYPQRVKAIRFRRNFGKAQALTAGFARARGDIIITMDADLQDDPEEIPQFLRKIDEGYDLVSGWKRKRNDPFSKTLPSKLFNAITQKVSGVRLHDFNCGFKAYRQEVLASIKLYGELHRYIPVLAHYQGFRIGEIVVSHNPRRHGKSKYGLERYIRGFLDLLTVIVTTKYLQKPGHLFGGMGILFGVIGMGALTYLTVLKIMGEHIGQRPLLLFGIMMVVIAVQFISLGLIAELLVRNAGASTAEHRIVSKINIDDKDKAPSHE